MRRDREVAQKWARSARPQDQRFPQSRPYSAATRCSRLCNARRRFEATWPLLQWSNIRQRFLSHCKCPRVKQFRLMQCSPLLYQPKNPGGKIAVDLSSLYANRGLVFPVNGMEMRRGMIAVVHCDDDAEETTELRHASNLTSCRIAAELKSGDTGQHLHRDPNRQTSLASGWGGHTLALGQRHHQTRSRR